MSCIDCNTQITVEQLLARAIVCDADGTKYLRVVSTDEVEGEICTTCLNDLSLTGLVRSLFDCDENGEPYIRVTGATAPPPPPVGDSLQLTWDNIANVPVADVNSVSDWNTFFDLPTKGTPFTSVSVTGNTVELFGATAIDFRSELFYDNMTEEGNPYIVAIIDETPCVENVESYCIQNCPNITDIRLPICNTVGLSGIPFNQNLNNLYLPLMSTAGQSAFVYNTSLNILSFNSLTTLGNSVFSYCTGLTSLSMQNLLFLGTTTGFDNVFGGISGNTITLTIPSALMTCDGGNPDGDIVDLQNNNTVTIITV